MINYTLLKHLLIKLVRLGWYSSGLAIENAVIWQHFSADYDLSMQNVWLLLICLTSSGKLWN